MELFNHLCFCVCSLYLQTLQSLQMKTTKNAAFSSVRVREAACFHRPACVLGLASELVEIYFGFQSKYFSGRWINSGSAHHVNCFSGTHDKVCFSNPHALELFKVWNHSRHIRPVVCDVRRLSLPISESCAQRKSLFRSTLFFFLTSHVYFMAFRGLKSASAPEIVGNFP